MLSSNSDPAPKALGRVYLYLLEIAAMKKQEVNDSSVTLEEKGEPKSKKQQHDDEKS